MGVLVIEVVVLPGISVAIRMPFYEGVPGKSEPVSVWGVVEAVGIQASRKKRKVSAI